MKKLFIKIISIFIFPKTRRREFRRAYLRWGVGKLKIKGRNNRFILVNEDGKEISINWPLSGLNIEIKGNNNTIKIGHPWRFENTKIKITDDNNYFEIKSCPMGVKETLFYVNRGAKVLIGENFGVSGYGRSSFFVGEEDGMSLIIGNNVLFATNNTVRTSDSHTIYDIKTDKICNFGSPIVIHDHVWICEGCAILKGAKIAQDCIIGTKSVVNKKFDTPNAIIVGTPAKIVKTGINWDAERIPDFKGIG